MIQWDVGTGQINGNFAVTNDSTFTGGAIQLGLRGEQRSIGAITPSPLLSADYLAQTGADPLNSLRAWWNFQLSINYAGGITNLDSLTLSIVRVVGTNGTGGVFNLLPGFGLVAGPGVINDDNTKTFDSYLLSQNPTFGWLSPSYNLISTDPFAYHFALTATEGETTVTGTMCVHTAGQDCATVPEPSSLTNVAAMGAILALFGFGLMRRRRAGV